MDFLDLRLRLEDDFTFFSKVTFDFLDVFSIERGFGDRPRLRLSLLAALLSSSESSVSSFDFFFD